MPDAFSVNQLRKWSRCQKQYAFQYVQKLLWPSDPSNFRLGKSVHQLLDYDSRTLPISGMLAATDADIRLAWQALKESRWAALPVIASEWDFSLEVGGRWIYGRIDRIVQDGDSMHILDWKTGTGIPMDVRSDWQTRIYLYAVYAARRDLDLPSRPDTLAFTYVQAKGRAVSEITVPYSQAMHEETEALLIATLDAMTQATSYALPAACPDRFCPYDPICGIKDTQSAEPAPVDASEEPDDLAVLLD